MTVHSANTAEEYARLLAAARGQGVAVQELGDFSFAAADQWEAPAPPKAPKASKPKLEESPVMTDALETSANWAEASPASRSPEKAGREEETGSGGEK